MQLSQIEAVVAIAETGSFRKAAERLGRTQPTLTKSIQSLEADFNQVIFERTPRGVRLTDAGARVYRRACTVMADITALNDEVRQMAGVDGGRIRIGVSPVGGTVIMPKALRQFRRAWPRVDVDLLNVMYPASMNMLREAALDMVIGPLPSVDAHASVRVEPLFDMDIVVATHASNPRRDTTRLDDLMQDSWIVHGPQDGPSSLFSGTFAGREGAMPQAFTHCHSLSATVALIIETGAFCIFSRQLFDTIAPSHGLVVVPIQDDLPRFRLSLVTQKSRPLTPAAAHLAQHIRRRAAHLVHQGFASDSLLE